MSEQRPVATRPTYRLFWSPGSAAMAPHAALIEIGQPFELVLASIDAGGHKTDDYRKLNPNARVPTLVDGDFVIYESAAILMYLAARHRAAKLMPLTGTEEYGRYLQWQIYLTNTVQEAFMHYFHPDYFCSPASEADLKARAEVRVGTFWTIVDEALGARGPYIAGRQFSTADLYLHMLSRWSRHLAKPAWHYPNIRRAVELVRERPSVQAMMTAQGLSEPF